MTIPTFTKLLPIRMVARSCSGLLKCLIIYLLLLCSEVFSSFKSLGDSEKKATSEPDSSAEQHSNIINMNIAIEVPKVSGNNSTIVTFVFIVSNENIRSVSKNNPGLSEY